MSGVDAMLARIQAFNRIRGGGVAIQKAARGYSLLSQRSGAPIARLRPTGEGDKVQVLWWNGERWGASGPFGIATMPLDEALPSEAHAVGGSHPVLQPLQAPFRISSHGRTSRHSDPAD